MMKKIFTFFAALACTVSMFAATETVYFVNAQNWTGTINAYAWTSASNAQWPGVPATKEAEKIAGCDVYSYTAEAGTYANVIFNNGSEKQTADLKWTAGKYYCKDGWYTKEDAAAKLGQPVEYESVYFVNVDGWANVKIYTWTPEVAAWPGEDMKKEATKLADKEVWSYTVEKGSAFGGMLFNDGIGTQTSDLKWEAGKYFVKDNWYTKEEAEAKLSGETPDPTPDPEPGTSIVSLAGEMNGWSADADLFIAAEDGLTASAVVALEAQTYQFKVVVDGAWLTNLGEMTRDNCTGWTFEAIDGMDNNAKIVADVAGDYTFTWTFATNTLTVAYPEAGEIPGDTTVTPEPEPEPNPGETKTIYLNTGGAQLWNQADAKFFVHAWGEGAAELDAQMTLVEGDVYQVEIPTAHTSIIFLRLAPTATGVVWEGNDLWNKTVDLTIPTESNCYTITGWEPEAGTWSSYTPGDTPVDPNPGDDPVVTPTAYYITGNDVLFGANAWKSDAIAMTEAEGVYTHTFTAVAAGVECQFKVTDGTWANSWGFSNLTTTPAGVTGNTDNNIIFTLAEAGDVTVNFNGKDITLVGNFTQSGDTTVTPEPEPEPNPGETKTIYLNTGGAQLWNQADAKFFGHAWGEGAAELDAQMTLVEGDVYQVEIPTAHTSIIFLRLAPTATGVVWEGNDLWNKTVDLTIPTESNCYTITGWEPEAGTWSSYTPGDTPVDPNPGDDPVVTPTAYYITGNDVLFGANAWKSDAIAMTEAEGVYTHTFTAVAAGVECQFKITDGTWDHSWGFSNLTTTPAGVTGNNDNNIIFTLAEAGDVVVTFNGTNITVTGNFAQGGDTPVDPTPGETKDITVKAKVPATWTDQITAWVWPTGGEGQEVIPTQEDEWYVYTQNCAELNIIFKNGAGWNGDANQTVDITVTESTCIEITAGEGKATYTVIDCEGGENPGDTTVTPEPTIGVTYNVTVPAGTNACYIAGELNGWSHQEMTKVDDTHYTLTVADATTAMKYKYCSGPSWDYVEMQADGVTDVQDRTYAENDVVEAWKAVYGDTTVTPEPTIGVTYNVTVPTGTNACYIAGELNGWSHQEMTKVDDTHYTLTVADATTAMKYKYCSGPGWAYVEKTADGGDVADRAYTPNDVVEAWAAVYDSNNVPSQGETKDITVKAKVPATWTDQITAWVWPTGGEGQEVIPTQEDEWYVYTQNCTELNIIFKNGAGWNGDANQTVDITVTESICIEITAGEGKATYTIVDCPIDGPTTDNEQVVINKKATKIVYNGQICIIRDGVMFNILGQVIK